MNIKSHINSENIEKDRSISLGKKLLTFSSKIETVYNTMKALNSFADVNSWSTISQLVAKLPIFGVNAWKKEATAIYAQEREPNLVDLIKFVKTLAERECHAYSNILSLKQKQSRSKDSSGPQHGSNKINASINATAASGKQDQAENSSRQFSSRNN